jgi:hypothetical protein
MVHRAEVPEQALVHDESFPGKGNLVSEPIASSSTSIRLARVTE